MNQFQYTILYEYDIPITMPYWLSAGAGLWFIVVSPGSITITDDQDETGTYDYTNATLYNIKSLRADGIFYSKTDSTTDCLLTDSSFYYDASTTKLYVHFENFDPPFLFDVFFGAAVGYTFGYHNTYRFNNAYYPPIVSKIFGIKQNKDPLFYGLLNFASGSVELINAEGTFDDWRSRNLYAQPSRLMFGNSDDVYADFETIFTGSIGSTKRDWKSISIKNEDIRKRLTQPIATNLLTQTDHPNLDDSNVDTPKPVAYGSIINAPCICLNENETGSPSTYTFLLCDTAWNQVDSLDAVYVDGTDQTEHATLDGVAGTFTLGTSYYSPSQNVTASFTVDIKNGVDIIVDLISNYDKKPYLASFWNTTEVDEAKINSRDTSIYIDDDAELKEVIEKVASDIDAIFYAQNDGRYTIRIYDEDREISKTIKADDWIDDPSIDDNQDQFLTSVIIKYNHDIDADEYYQYENKDYEATAYETYKTYKNKTYETGLTSLADAQDKSETILDYSSNVRDIITRSVPFRTQAETFYDIGPMDFILCDPEVKPNETEELAVYEILGVDKNFEKATLKLTMRYIKEDPTIYYSYDVFTDGTDDFINVSGETLLYRRII